MPAHLKPSPLPRLRDPLDALRLRGWVHAGNRPLDGVLMDRGSAGPDWQARLVPWLGHAAEIRANGDFVLVLFPTPLVRDCSALGPCLPVLRLFGILTSAPFAEPERALAEDLREKLVLVAAGRARAVPLGAFVPLDVAGWWALDGVALVASERVPVLRSAPPRRRVSAPALGAVGVPFADIRETLAQTPRRKLRHVLADFDIAARRWIGRLIPYLWLACIVLFLLGIQEGETDWSAFARALIIGLIVMAIVFFRRDTTGSPGTRQVPSIPATGQAAGLARRPFWRRAAAWIAWRSPYAARLRRLYAERIAEVERLFASERTDEALRKAIGLSGSNREDGAFADLPLTGPGLRTRLDLDFGPRGSSGLSLAPQDETRLRALYRAQASALAKAGHVERAAFVLDELVGAPIEAVRLLAEAERFESAARLAEARRLGAGQAVPLWFRAGRTERALALAARHDAFAELWKEVRIGDPFRDVLAEAWTKRLVAAGAFDRAAAIARDVRTLAEARRGWIAQALGAHSPPQPESLARALRALPWQTRDTDAIHAAFREFLAEPGAQGMARRLALAGHLADRDFEGGPPSPPTPAFAFVSRALARRLAADEGTGHDSERARLAANLAETGGQVALRQHFRRLAHKPGPASSASQASVQIADGPALAEIADATLLSGDRLLIGYRSGLIRLLGRGGRERWRGQVEGLLGFASVGSGDKAFVLRQTLDGLALLVFDPATGQLAQRGGLSITHWHPHATETGWLVFDGEAMAMLDPAPLLAGPGMEGQTDGQAEFPLAHHWRLPVTEPGIPLALAGFGDASVLIFARVDGLVEWWSLSARTLAVTCRFWTPPPVEPGAVLGITEAVAWGLEDRDGLPALRAHAHAFTSATRENERALIEGMARAESHTLPRLAVDDRGRVWASCLMPESTVWSIAPGPNRIQGAKMTWQGSSTLRTRFSRKGNTAVIFDEKGRLVVLDPRSGQVSTRLL